MKKFLTLLLVLFPATALLPLTAGAAEVGEPVPAFTMQASDGLTYTQATLKGAPFVIAFFPKVFTGG